MTNNKEPYFRQVTAGGHVGMEAFGAAKIKVTSQYRPHGHLIGPCCPHHVNMCQMDKQSEPIIQHK